MSPNGGYPDGLREATQAHRKLAERHRNEP